jgi:glycosyltransferase involved in cell wall biosynthesis
MNMSNSLRVVHVAEDIDRIAGGIPAVVRQLTCRLSKRGVSVQIAHATGDSSGVSASVEVLTYPPLGRGKYWSSGKGLKRGLFSLTRSNHESRCVFHIHGAWSAPQYYAALACIKTNTPFIFTAHGMLEPWLWNQQGWTKWIKKKIYWLSMAYPVLSKATVIHAITPLEQKNLQALFPKNRVEVIPNAIEINDETDVQGIERQKSILFLGRIEPKKGVDLLLEAFSIAKVDKSWSVNIVGPSWSNNYLLELIALVARNGLSDRVRFHGALFGDEKNSLIDRAWVLVVPSHSEVIGLVNLEAAARRLPTITTTETGLYDWELGGGLLISPYVDSLARALEDACSWSMGEQFERGLASRNLVLQRYSWQAVTPMWMNLYNSLF